MEILLKFNFKFQKNVAIKFYPKYSSQIKFPKKFLKLFCVNYEKVFTNLYFDTAYWMVVSHASYYI